MTVAVDGTDTQLALCKLVFGCVVNTENAVGCRVAEQVGELTPVDSRNSLGRNDFHAGLRTTDGHQASADRLRLSWTHCHGADGELSRETLASRAEHTRGTTAQQTLL